MKLPTPLVATIGGAVGIAAAVIAFQSGTTPSATEPTSAPVTDIGASTPSTEETPSTPKASPSVTGKPSSEAHVRARSNTRTSSTPKPHYSSTSTAGETENEGSYESGDD